ncbi:MAG: electron transfer flavoprotein subunit beta/FixA family protein [Acidimicrobiales bacterium]
MRVLVCIKRVPAVGGRIVLDGPEIDTRFLGFTMSPHEECAVEEAVRLVAAHGGESVVVTLGPPASEEQLRYALSLGIDRAVLVETDGGELGPRVTARELAAVVAAEEASGGTFDVLLFGNEAPDTGDFQVGIRVAEALGRPCVSGVKQLAVEDGTAVAMRDRGRDMEVYRVALPAVVAVKEGLNLPRYPSLPGRLKAKSKPLDRRAAAGGDDGLRKVGLRVPGGDARGTQSLGTGAGAAPRVVELLDEVGVLVP